MKRAAWIALGLAAGAGAGAAVTIFSYVFIVGEIKRVKLVKSLRTAAA
jgi:ACS family glucarate transporter-like MFS transporter